MPRKKKAHSFDKAGQLVIHDAEALRAGQIEAVKELNAMTGEDEWEWGDPPPNPAPVGRERRQADPVDRPGGAG